MRNNHLNAENVSPDREPIRKTLSDEKIRSWIYRRLNAAYVPASVYRIQLNQAFTFRDATEQTPYFSELGVAAVYCSPYFQASPGSMHGYNITDPGRLNPEIGPIEAFDAFCAALTENSLGQIVDVVPNHMGVTGNNNPWWNDVLENGPSSPFARYFDIDWSPVKQELRGKVLLPVLGNFYGRVLENQEIRLAYRAGEFFLLYFDHRFPVDPKTYALILADAYGALGTKMRPENPDYLEYLSVLTALKNLPASSESEAERTLERSREKEIAKQRLRLLADRCESVRLFIESRILHFNGDIKDPRSFDDLDRLLNAQSYRLAFWNVASQEINYRRFFDINELAAIRIEDEKVFRHYHEFLFQLVKEGRIQGFRIDHPDGLYDPPVYFQRLQREYLLQMILKGETERSREEGGETVELDLEDLRDKIDRLLSNEFSSMTAFYVVAEKILDRKEPLPENWNVHGTVGYDFLNVLNGLFVDSTHEEAFAGLYRNFIGHRIDFDELVYNKKKFFGLVPMASEINALGDRLDRISETNRKYRDYTRNDLTVAIREVIAGFPVYRTYVTPASTSVSERDERYIREAVAKARKKTPALSSAVFDFLRDALLLRLNVEPGSEEEKLYRDFLLRFQQLTGPIMAKGVEDTSFYVYNRLVSLNEVGGDPFFFGHSRSDFHSHNRERNRRWPNSMMTTSTHDTKRSEDVRMRINVLSEIPAEWDARIHEWAGYHCRFKTEVEGHPEPRKNTEYFFYQTLIGIWPDEQAEASRNDPLIERIWQYVLKSVREAKIYTNWVQPDAGYEEAVKRFIFSVLLQGKESAFYRSFLPFQRKISFYAKLNGLSATVLKVASPGVVDLYQGNETWNYSLVDPDNRRPVDFESRKQALRSVAGERSGANPGGRTVSRWTEEGLKTGKLFFTLNGLRFRQAHRDLFIGGEYVPVEVTGPRENCIVAFIRRRGRHLALAAAGRFFTRWPAVPSAENGADFLTGTELVWPEDVELPGKLKDIMTSGSVDVIARGKTAVIRAADLFHWNGAALLTNITDET